MSAQSKRAERADRADRADRAGPQERQALIEIADLRVQYRTSHGAVRAVDGVDLALAPGETLALVGESGSGKSTIAHSIMGALPANARIAAGRIDFEDMDLARLSERRFNRVRGRLIGFIPQDPMVSLNPLHRVGRQVAAALRIHELADRRAAHEQAIELLGRVGLPQPAARARQFPHELSGGMRQRALIAAALAGQPRLLVADEPTTALDVTVQRVILDDLARLAREQGIAILIITHDLAVAGDRADRIAVLRQGKVVEQGTPEDVLGRPEHPYTQMLMRSAPSLAAPVRARRSGPPRPRSPIDDDDLAQPSERSADRAAERPADRSADRADPIVQVRAVAKEFRLAGGDSPDGRLRAVDGVSLDVLRGETLGLVGESGSGKSTLARLILGLESPSAGSVLFEGVDVAATRGRARRAVHAKAQLIYQNPYASLNPRMTVRQLVAEPLSGFGIGDGRHRRERVAQLLDQVGLGSGYEDRRPAELSGGQRQRVAIARALAPSPDLIVCDEPVSALDVSIQAQVLDLLDAVQRDLGVSLLFISHDLAVIRQIADRVGVMKDGRLVELADTADIFSKPSHEYTQRLLDAIPGRRFAEVPA